MKICLVEKCGRENHRKNLCSKHYQKWKKYGNPLAGQERNKNGSSWITSCGYRIMTIKGKGVFEHNVIIEKVLGHKPTKGSVPHHVDGNKLRNINSNLVLCDSQAYHMLLHHRMRALKACGHANWHKCCFCKKWDDPSNLYIRNGGKFYSFHRDCHNDYERKRRADSKTDLHVRNGEGLRWVLEALNNAL